MQQHMLHIKSKCGPRFWYIDYLMNIKATETCQAITVHINTDSLTERLSMLISSPNGPIPLLGCHLYTGRDGARNVADLLIIAFRIARDVHQSKKQISEDDLKFVINPQVGHQDYASTNEYYVLTGERLSRSVGSFHAAKRPISKSIDFPAGRSTEYKFSAPFTFNSFVKGNPIDHYDRIVPFDLHRGLYTDHHFFVKVVDGDWRHKFVSVKVIPVMQFAGTELASVNIGFLLNLYSVDESYNVVSAKGAIEPIASVQLYPLINVEYHTADVVFVDKLGQLAVRGLNDKNTKTLLNDLALKTYLSQLMDSQGVKDFEIECMTASAGLD